ncbi:hypothetical protein GALMADRAFT_226327 [Galerina marginata CBS 339.88]|uniref:RING-type domain-containing protein n=1 Tax=Galerina marginata (strain CBS 339.88) TaxID=685588 RepID=A0A067T028_GALM3|nr:hypothetical protein GALMADRAFT_226327 [Galerina marginata CBS 339.88]
MARDCVNCVVEFATLKFVPCGHYSCDSCSSFVTKCPSCEKVILGRKRIAAAMTVPGAEDDFGVEAGSLDDRLVKMKSISGTTQVITFMMKKDRVSSLTGEEKDSK